MKKFLAYLLVAMMLVSSFAACGNGNAGNEETSHLKKAADYIYAMYKDKGTTTAQDFERTAQVMIGTTKYAVEWTTDNDAVKVTTNGTVATIDVAERSEAEIKYTLTATVKDADGKTESVTFNYTVPKWEGFTKIVEDAYKLEAGKAMDGAVTLEGTITQIDTAWSDSYKNITVTIAVPGIEDKPIMCYRLSPTNKDDAALVAQCAGLKVGDYITVTGNIKNYNGTIEFDAGCTLDALVAGAGDVSAIPEDVKVPAGATDAEIVDLAWALENGQKFASEVTLTGVITSIKEAYTDQYKNISVIVQVGDKADKPIVFFRMKGDGIENLKVGDTVTATGLMKNYNGTIEFDAGCKYVAPAIDWSAQYVGDYQAHIIPVADFAAYTHGFTLTFDYETLKDGYSYWNFTLINNTDGWPKLLDAKYYVEKPKFSEWDFVDVSGNGTYTVTFTKDAVAELVTAGGLGIQVFGMVAHDIKLTPVEAPVEVVKLYVDEAVNENLQKTEVGYEHGMYDDTHGYLSLRAAVDFENNGKVIFYADVETPGLYTLEIDYTAKTGSAKRMIALSVNGAEPEQIDLPTADEWKIEYLMTYKTFITLKAGENEIVLCTPKDYDNSAIKCPNVYAIKYSLKKAEEVADLTTPEGIVKAAFQLADGEYLSDKASFTLTGVVTKATYNEQYGDATTYFIIGGLIDMEMMCYQLKGDVANLKEGDIITVTGPIKNYKGTIEFERPTLDKVEAGETPATPEEPVAQTTEEILKAAYALADMEVLGDYTLTGVITEITTAYSEQYKNITVVIVIDGLTEYPLTCFRLKGEGAETLAVGDTITVSGSVMNYGGLIEYNSGCKIDAIVKGAAEAPAASAGLDLSAGLTAGTDYNGISVFEDFVAKEDGREIDGVAYTYAVYGSTNASPKGGAVPETGAVVKVTPTANGTFTIVFKLNSGKQVYFVDGDANQIGFEDATENCYLTRTYNVEAGKVYYFYGQGTKPYIYKLSLDY